jgi:glycosidase
MKKVIFAFSILLFLASCENSTPEATSDVNMVNDSVLVHPAWSKNATIYEANIRQMTPEGTFKGLEGQLEKIKELGVKIVWLMPIQPIGELNRKGELGSYYSVSDYNAINPEYGDLNDFKSLVNKAHELDMKVIIDWAANHCAWDNVWTVDHPEWFTQDSLGNFVSPVPDWSDVIDLNFDNEEMQAEMIASMKYWVTETDIDGYRCDVAYRVPTSFWNKLRQELDQIKPVFMLAEADMPEHHNEAFDMSYGWELMHIMNHIAKGDSSLESINEYMMREEEKYSSNDYRMYFLTNHDENSWNGTIEKRFGPAEKPFAVLAYTINGMPLIYSGQEYGNNKALEFFQKDSPNYADPAIYDFYKTLMHLNMSNEALWNGDFGGDYIRIATTDDEHVFALKRQKGNHVVIAISNFTDQETPVFLSLENEITLTDAYSNEEISLSSNSEIILEPYGYRVLFK